MDMLTTMENYLDEANTAISKITEDFWNSLNFNEWFPGIIDILEENEQIEWLNTNGKLWSQKSLTLILKIN